MTHRIILGGGVHTRNRIPGPFGPGASGMSEQLLQTVLKHSGSKNSRLHGQVHWASVAAAGFTLCELTPEAERAMEVVKELLEKPVNRAEALLEWVAGRPVSFPVANNNKSPEKAIDDQLRAWGWDGIANERKQQQLRGRKKESWEETRWKH